MAVTEENVVTQMLETAVAPDVAKLRAAMRGPVIVPGDRGYDAVRRIWNAAAARRPAVIARCTGVADVIAALRFGREHDLAVAVRGGGHNVAGTALCDGGLVIDLQLMKGMRVSPGSARLLAQPGVRLGDVDHETQAFGLAAVCGINSETGLSGLTLGGGIGWQMRSGGLTIDHLVAADVITADGKLLRASAEENADLFWAIRGGGGNFGIVTAFEFDLVQLGPAVCGGLVMYAAERAPEVLRAYRDWAAHAPDEITTIAILRLAPAFPWVSAELVGRPVLAIGALFAGDAERGMPALLPLTRLGSVLASSLGVRSFVEHQAMLDASAPAGRLYYWKSHYFAGLTDAAIDVITRDGWGFSSPFSFTLLSHMGGAVRRHADDETAFSGRDAEFSININCAATARELYETDRAWVRRWFDALAPHATGGVYVNFVSDEGADAVHAAYGDSKLRRLAQIKATFDPDNVFRVNQNIRPDAST
jgi:FAD/FMN-containing dehydrogenase